MSELRCEEKRTAPEGVLHVKKEIEMKIIVRSNPGLVLLNRGTVVKKWAWRDVPAWEAVKGDLIP